jgi:selenide, water dikinase
LKQLPRKTDKNLLVGYETSDDAAVYRLDDETALVHTADLITPPVDDPFLFGQIGAANSLSDIYAMGGRPVTCLNLIGFPSNDLEPEILHGIVEGALSKITEAGAVLAGGHTTDDDEPKFGLSVTGIVHPEKFWRNSGAKVGDALILTKPIGSGVLFNANLKGWVTSVALEECVRFITTLNRRAAELMADYEIHAATDVTGFGLAGHALEMARGSGVLLNIKSSEIPVMSEALAMYEKGMTTGVNAANRAIIKDECQFDSSLSEFQRELLVDPQTSGGLLVSLPESESKRLLRVLHDGGIPDASIIGYVTPASDQTHLSFS